MEINYELKNDQMEVLPNNEEKIEGNEVTFEGLASEAEELLEMQDELEKMLQKLEKKMKTVPFVGTALSYIPLMISLVRSYMKKEYEEIPVASVIGIIVALSYVLMPVDIIPDIIPGIGYIDDGAIISGCLALIKTDIIDYKVWREEKGYAFEDLIDYQDIEKEAKSRSRIVDAFFKGKNSSK